jgi:hypothetical protein
MDDLPLRFSNMRFKSRPRNSSHLCQFLEFCSSWNMKIAKLRGRDENMRLFVREFGKEALRWEASTANDSSLRNSAVPAKRKRGDGVEDSNQLPPLFGKFVVYYILVSSLCDYSSCFEL